MNHSFFLHICLCKQNSITYSHPKKMAYWLLWLYEYIWRLENSFHTFLDTPWFLTTPRSHSLRYKLTTHSTRSICHVTDSTSIWCDDWTKNTQITKKVNSIQKTNHSVWFVCLGICWSCCWLLLFNHFWGFFRSRYFYVEKIAFLIRKGAGTYNVVDSWENCQYDNYMAICNELWAYVKKHVKFTYNRE